jgi:hypothetical protein
LFNSVVVGSGIRDLGSGIRDPGRKNIRNPKFAKLAAIVGLLQSFVLLGITSFGERTCGNGEILK